MVATKKVDRNPTLTDLMILAAIAFGTVSFAHFGGNYLSAFFTTIVDAIPKGMTRNIFTFLDSSFFWMITITTIIGVLLSYTKAKKK